MLISINWIKEFVDLPPLSPQELGEKFTLGSAEVEEVIVENTHLENIFIVEVISVEKHPSADHLQSVSFKIDNSHSHRVICGANNVVPRMKTAFAKEGTRFPNGMILSAKKIRGILSKGMLCSAEELGLEEKSQNIIEFSSDAPVGLDLFTFFKKTKNILFDIDNKSLTHRPDMWGHFGVARECAAIFNSELKDPYDHAWEALLTKRIEDSSRGSSLKIVRDEDSSNLGFFGLTLDDVRIGASSKKMIERLESLGIKPLNNIVDISNYVMLELGVPIHIYDRDKIKGDKLFISRAKEGTSMTTLDFVERVLLSTDTVISDRVDPLVIAGIMGGERAMVSEGSRQIFIEVANWTASDVRKTSNRLALRTDASERFEKSLDSQLLKRTLMRTFELILESCPEVQVVGDIQYAGPDLEAYRPRRMITSASRISKVLGTLVSKEKIASILRSLDFKINFIGEKIEVIVPSFRALKDIEEEADIVEEIGRIIGYDNIEVLAPQLPITSVKFTTSTKLLRSITDFMIFHAHAYELSTYPLEGNKFSKNIGLNFFEDEKIELFNALSDETKFLKNSLLPSLLKITSENSKHFEEFKMFDISRVYRIEHDKTYKEETHLGIVFYGREEAGEFLNMANIIHRLLKVIDLKGEIVPKDHKFKNSILDESWEGCHPHEFSNIKIMGRMRGLISSIHPMTIKRLKMRGNVAVALIDLTPFLSQNFSKKITYKRINKFPFSSFDWTIVAGENDAIEEIVSIAKKAKIKNLVSVAVKDVYPLKDRKKAVTLRARFMAEEQTIKREDLRNYREQLIGTYAMQNFNLKI